MGHPSGKLRMAERSQRAPTWLDEPSNHVGGVTIMDTFSGNCLGPPTRFDPFFFALHVVT